MASRRSHRQQREIDLQVAIQNEIRRSERVYWARYAAEQRAKEQGTIGHNGGPPLEENSQ